MHEIRFNPIITLIYIGICLSITLKVYASLQTPINNTGLIYLAIFIPLSALYILVCIILLTQKHIKIDSSKLVIREPLFKKHEVKLSEINEIYWEKTRGGIWSGASTFVVILNTGQKVKFHSIQRLSATSRNSFFNTLRGFGFEVKSK